MTKNINELSTKTLRSYVNKADKQAYSSSKKGDAEEDRSMSTDGYKYPEKQKRHQDAAQKHFAHADKRQSGRDLALGKLGSKALAAKTINAYRGATMFGGKIPSARISATEETQIDELSKGTLGRYISKAATNAMSRVGRAEAEYGKSDAAEKLGAGTKAEYHRMRGDNLDRGAQKRRRGIDMAIKKLTKEGVDTNFGRNKPQLDALSNNDWDPNYSDSTNVVDTGPQGQQDKSEAPQREPQTYEKMQSTRPKMDAIPDDGKWDPLYLESADLGDIVAEGDVDSLYEVFDAIIRAKIDEFFSEVGDEDEDYSDADDELDESEQIDELSKRTLGQYLHKATLDLRKKSYKHGENEANQQRVRANVSALGSHAARAGGDVEKALGIDFETIRNNRHKIDMRHGGIETATKKLSGVSSADTFRRKPYKSKNEDVEQIDELSKKTLGNYINKAADNAALNHADVVGARRDRDDAAMMTNTNRMPRKIKDDFRDAVNQDSYGREEKSLRNVRKRIKGIAAAVKKLTKEETLDELSAPTLSKYVQKALANRDKNAGRFFDNIQKGRNDLADKAGKKMDNREHGVKLAKKILVIKQAINGSS